MAHIRLLLADPCCYCGDPKAELDHIIPLSAGGPDTWENLTSSCRSCNSQKGTDGILLFLARRNGHWAYQPGVNETTAVPDLDMRRLTNAKLVPAQVLEIRASSEDAKALAERYGVSRNTIAAIRRGQTWKALLAA